MEKHVFLQSCINKYEWPGVMKKVNLHLSATPGSGTKAQEQFCSFEKYGHHKTFVCLELSYKHSELLCMTPF